MPTIDFTLPHWAYWVGLIAFPAIAMVLARRESPERRLFQTPLAYLILATGGILGLHRIYLKNLWGLLFLPVFAVVLYATASERDARSESSNADNVVRVAERTIEREGPRVEAARAEIEELRAVVAEAEEGSFAKRGAERRLARAEQRIETGVERLAEAERELETARPAAETARDARAFWSDAARYAFYLILAMMAVDALLVPMLVRAANARLADEPVLDAEAQAAQRKIEAEEAQDDSRFVSQGWTGSIDRLCLYAGEFVSYWAVIAVFVYYYEVIARYVFNSPTSWAHESMYLMFGMQYLIAGSYALLTGSHVRVDIFYAPMSRRRKALADLLTSIFFFIFAGTLLVTCWIFAFDAIAVPAGNSTISDWARGEVDFAELLARFSFAEFFDPSIRIGEISFNEWEPPLWPMKWMMVLGALLLILQGVSKIAQDVRALIAPAREG